MRRNLGIAFIFILVSLLSACNEYEENMDTSQLVVEGYIDSGGFPLVTLTTNVPIQNEHVSLDSLEQYLARWAVVRVGCDDKVVTLTGKWDSRYYPPYIYTTTEMRGEEGKTYTLTVDWKDHHAEASTTIPPAAELDSIWATHTENNDTLCQIQARFTDPQDTHDYYKLFVRGINDRRNYLSCYMGQIDDVTLSAAENDVYINRGTHSTSDDYTPFYSVNDTVQVKFARLDSVSYQFWDSMQKITMISNSAFYGQHIPIRGNVTGALGSWCGYGCSEYWIPIKDYLR